MSERPSVATIRATVAVTVRRKVTLDVPATKWPSRIAQTIQERITADGDEVVEFHYVEWEKVHPDSEPTLAVHPEQYRPGDAMTAWDCDSCGRRWPHTEALFLAGRVPACPWCGCETWATVPLGVAGEVQS